MDFLIGRLVVEVDGNIHPQTNTIKDTYLFRKGYVPVHVSAYERNLKALEKEILYLVKANNANRYSIRKINSSQ